MSPVPSNYPPGVTGNEPEITGACSTCGGFDDHDADCEAIMASWGEDPDLDNDLDNDGPLRGERVRIEGYELTWYVREHRGTQIVVTAVGDDARWTFHDSYATVVHS